MLNIFKSNRVKNKSRINNDILKTQDMSQQQDNEWLRWYFDFIAKSLLNRNELQASNAIYIVTTITLSWYHRCNYINMHTLPIIGWSYWSHKRSSSSGKHHLTSVIY